jgi:hypothetical protein
MATLMAAILTKAPARPRYVDALLAEVMAGLLTKDPVQRLDALAAARALAGWRAGQAVKDPAGSLPLSPTAVAGGLNSPSPSAAAQESMRPDTLTADNRPAKGSTIVFILDPAADTLAVSGIGDLCGPQAPVGACGA